MLDEGKDGFESKEISYHSKSPEKLLEELKRKNQDSHSKFNRNKRTALILIAVSGLIIAGAALFFVIYNSRSGNDPDYLKNIHSFVFKIVSETEYEYGHENEIKVRVSNIDNKEASFSFSDFKFTITSESGERVFAFSFPIETVIQMAEYDSRDIYDFRRENPQFMVKPGTYTIHSEFLVNENPVELKKPFRVFENVQTEVKLYNDYALPAQELPVYLTIMNNSPDDMDVLLGSYNVFLENPEASSQEEEIRATFVKNEDVMGEYQVLQRKKLDIRLGTLRFPSTPGDYLLKATYFLNDDLNEYQTNLMVRPLSRTDGTRRLRILPYTKKVVGIDENYHAEILIVNDADRDIFERVKGFIFEILRDNVTLYRYTKYDEEDINIFIPAYSKKTLFDSTEWRDISFQESGNCELRVRIILENGIMEFSEEILVEK